MCRSLVAGSVLFVLFANVPDAPGASTRFRRPAPAAQPAVSVDELISVVFPEHRNDPETGVTVFGPTAIPVRRIDLDDEPEVLEGVTELGASLVMSVPDGAETRHVLYLAVEGETVNYFTPFRGRGALVAVIDAGPTRRVLDLVDVQSDRESDIVWDGPASRLGPDGRAFVVTSEHHNSSQNYHAYDVLTVNGGRIRSVASIALLSWGTETENVTETATFRVVPRRGSRFGDVVVSVTVDRRPYPGSTARRRTRRSVRTYHETYRWRGPERGYVDAGGTLDVVVELNAAHY